MEVKQSGYTVIYEASLNHTMHRPIQSHLPSDDDSNGEISVRDINVKKTEKYD